MSSILPVTTAAILLGGCASVGVVSVQESRTLAPTAIERGGGAVVEDFHGGLDRTATLFYDTRSSLIRNRGGGEVSPTGGRLAEALRKELRRRGIGGGLRVAGQVIEEEGGNAGLRVIVGLGAGGSRLSARTLVFNEAKSKSDPWLVIWTEGGSGREPGAAFSFIPPPVGTFLLPVAAGGAGAALLAVGGRGTGQDARRTAKVVADTIEWGHAMAGGGSGRVPKFRGTVKVAGGAAVPFTREGRHLAAARTSYATDQNVGR